MQTLLKLVSTDSHNLQLEMAEEGARLLQSSAMASRALTPVRGEHIPCPREPHSCKVSTFRLQ